MNEAENVREQSQRCEQLFSGSHHVSLIHTRRMSGGKKLCAGGLESCSGPLNTAGKEGHSAAALEQQH